jgi:hypothetical protein
VTNGAGIGTPNHSHSLTIPLASINAGVPDSFTIMGAHTHTVSLSAANFTTLRAGGTVVVTSSAAGHTHQVTLSCG